MLQSIIKSKTRINILVKFFLNSSNKSYLNSLASEFGESTNSVRKELNNLSKAGYLLKKNHENKIYYSANVKHPLFGVIHSIIKKHLGIENIIQKILLRIGDVNKIILLGDYAEGIDSGYIEVLIVGNKINEEYLNKIRPKIEQEINRKVNFLITSTGTSQKGLVVFEE